METPVWIPILIGTPLFIVGLWCAVLSLISRFGGWAKLAEPFAVETPFEGHARRGFQRLQLGRATAYKNCITFGVDERGLWISVMAPFRFRHPALYIPWSEIETDMSHSRRLKLTFPSVPGVTATMSRRVFEELAREAGTPIGWEATEA